MFVRESVCPSKFGVLFMCLSVCPSKCGVCACESVKIRSLREGSKVNRFFQRQKSGEKSGCVIPRSFHCLLLGGPHGFLQPLLVARVLR